MTVTHGPDAGAPGAPRTPATLLPDAGLLPDGTADALGAELARLLDASPPEATLVAASIPVAPVDAIAVHRVLSDAGASPVLWHQPSRGRSFVGAGETLRIELDGAGRFDDAAMLWAAVARGATVSGPAAGVARGPVLLGGGTFAPVPSSDPVWRGFERGWLAVPRLVLELRGERAFLTASIAGATADVQAAALGAIRDLVAHLEREGGSVPADAPPARLDVVGRAPDRRAWSSSVARSAGAVGRGRIDKVVLARRVDLAAPAPLDVAAVLRRLEASAPASTIFALERDGRTFLGATPERLVETRGRTFHTVALAGTRGRATDEAEDDRLAAELAASEKDREEHQVVVAMLRETLRPLADRLDVAPRPHVVRHRTVQHLATEVSGTVADGTNLLSLVEALHPTPAVGGWPRDLALELLAEQEQLDRGWYAGPVGWIDTSGDGEFVVAIRSGVVDGSSASLFAGCGIVADSEPDAEWEEGELKLRALASAIGRVEE